MRRCEIIFELIEDHDCDPRTLLDALVRALPEDIAREHIEYILRVGDYSMRLDDDGNLIKQECE